MKTFAIVFSCMVALFVGATSANAQTLRSGQAIVRTGGSHVDFGIGVNIGGGRHHGGGVDIWIGGGNRYPGDYRRGPVYRGPVYRGPVYRGPVYRGPVYRGPVYSDPGCYDPCGPSSTIVTTVWETVLVPEVYIDQWGRQVPTGRYHQRQVQRTVTAWYDPAYGAYVYTDSQGNLRIVR